MFDCLRRHRLEPKGRDERRTPVSLVAQRPLMRVLVRGHDQINLLIPPAHVPLRTALDVRVQAPVPAGHSLVEGAVNHHDHHVGPVTPPLDLAEVLRQLGHGVEALAVHVEAVLEARQPPGPVARGAGAVALLAAACAPGLEVPPDVGLGRAVERGPVRNHRP